jgi:hypothetical protein
MKGCQGKGDFPAEEREDCENTVRLKGSSGKSLRLVLSEKRVYAIL